VWFARTEGILVEAVGPLWAAFCPTTGETVLLNDESASILEILQPGAADLSRIALALADDIGITAESINDLLDACWPGLIEAGLVREAPLRHTMPA